MHDIRAIRANPAAFDAALARRMLAPIADSIVALDVERRATLTKLQELQAERRLASRSYGTSPAGQTLGRIKDPDSPSKSQELQDKSDPAAAVAKREAIAARSRKLKEEIEALEALAERLDGEIRSVLEALPNILDPDVPDGPDESANVVLKQVGGPRDLGFQPKQHFELGEAMGLMDFATAAKLAGARFVVLRGPLARLERALGQFMIDLHTRDHGFTEMVVPSLVNDAAVYGTTQLPKFADDLFHTTDGRWLIPTAEVPLTNTVAGEIVPEKALPIRITALTDCYRAEAGAAGRDTRGMLRQHQFRKVEMVAITHPDHSVAEQERMVSCAEKVLSLLEIPFRRVVLSSGDTGFASARTFDLEVWLPGQQAWREISSTSNCRDFQARRMNARFRAADGKGVAYVHTLNGSGVAVGRALIAVMENHQQADGSVLIPEVLWPYMAGIERIGPA
jgi:seryl-tRNA synthetase